VLWAGEGFPSCNVHLLTIPSSIPRGVLGRCTSRFFTSSMAFVVSLATRRPLVPFRAGITRPQGSLNAADWSAAPSNEAFDTTLRRRAFPPDAGSLLPGALVLTGTGLPPAGEHHLWHGALLCLQPSPPLIRPCSLGTQTELPSKLASNFPRFRAQRGSCVV